ncbi:fungal specific transcription factor domain-containing protein [Cladophialophora carrionii]|uniref:Fungal specific transcription factor domain-containing protein n=1 Tax=Cladophialophora carrionii TaxID=86049 RepID=A0A1C1CU95_9EURO|nr:fungal specific transcription factor domain-containing protein [Cladophialophora carrionii]
MTKPESVEALLNPSLRVSRPVAACARCRSAKIKCDGKLPACSACERSGKATSCTSANDEFARGKERSYVAALEAAAQRLQKKIDMARVEAAGHQAASGASSAGRPQQRRKISGARRREASDVDELVSDFGFLTVNATSRDFHGFTSTMSFAKLLLSAAARDELPPLEMRGLPPRYAITPMINQYLENIFVLFPFFSETDLMASLSRIYNDSAAASSTVTPLDVWYVRLILATVHAANSQRKGDENDSTALQHMSAARGLAGYVLHPGSIAGVQALLLLVQYSLVDPAHYDSWYLVGMAARLVVDLGLHCEPAPETRISKSTLDLRRRIFHCTYAFDRLVSMSLDRAFSFTDDSASEVPLPESVADPSPSQVFQRLLKPSLYLFDIRRVQSAFYQTTRWSSRSQWPLATAATYASTVSNDIHAWYSTIPPTLSQRHLMLFNLERLYSHILVVSPNQRVPASSMTDLNKELVFEYSAQYADLLQPIAQDISWHAYLTYADICRAKYVGQKFVEVMWSDFDRLIKTTHAVREGSPLANNVPLDNGQRATICLRKIIEILDFARHRWAMPEMRERFEQESAVLFSRLKSRQMEFGASQYSTNPGLVGPNTGYGSGSNQYAYDGPVLTQLPSPPINQDPVRPDVQQQRMLTPPEEYHMQPGPYPMPQGTLPRRSYEFHGGRS